jgi:hypothetical protein
VLENSKVDLVEVLLWRGNSAAAALENYIQSLTRESPAFTDKPICYRRLNEEAISV